MSSSIKSCSFTDLLHEYRHDILFVDIQTTCT